jgi:hypothetical protein
MMRRPLKVGEPEVVVKKDENWSSQSESFMESLTIGTYRRTPRRSDRSASRPGSGEGSACI